MTLQTAPGRRRNAGELSHHLYWPMLLDRSELELGPLRDMKAIHPPGQTSSTADQSMFRSQAWRDTSMVSWAEYGSASGVNVIEVLDRKKTPEEVLPPDVVALVSRRTQWRHIIMPVRVIALNQSSIAELDQTWIEKNGFFGRTDADFEWMFRQLLTLLLARTDWDELWLPGLTDTCADSAILIGTHHGLSCRVELEQFNYQVDLDHLRLSPGVTFLDSLSANTRQQLRRSLRAAQASLGRVEIQPAKSATQALEWFDLTAPLHRERWGRTAPLAGSGFDNPAFVSFHRELIGRSFEKGAVQYLRLSCGDRPIGYLYNLVCGRTTEFYLSGFDYRVLPANARPGLLAHWYAIEHNLALGQGTYDFLAGDARYKRSFSNRQGKTVWIVMQRKQLKLAVESMGRWVKRHLFRSDTPGEKHDR